MEKTFFPIEKLKEWDKNPRTITKENFERLKNQIKELGEYKPLIITPDGTVLGGNMRLRAYRELGFKQCWVSIINPKTEEEKIKYALSDNDQLGEYQKDDLANLLGNYPSLDLSNYTLNLSKNTPVVELLDQFKEVVEDEAPEVDKSNVKSKYGEVYQLGRHRLMCGDATKKEDVEKLMDGKKADMVFTDPPYNVGYGISKNPCHNIRTIRNDKQTSRQWYDFCNAINIILKEYNNGDIYLWGASGPEGMRQRLWLTEAGCHWSATIIWKKQQLVLTPANYQRMYEACFYGWFNKSSYNGDRTQTEVWEIDRPLKSNLHPTMKPIELSDKAINNSSKINDIVLDLFGGSGSTLISCEKINRICYMMEIEPVYCDVIIKRWEDYTGQKAVKL